MTDPIPHLNKALEGRYEVERQIGLGGMATVFLARDLKHNRRVALKVLKPELAAVVGAERFLAEIETTANLQHPHILPLFDSGQAGAFLYYVMPYVEGETLRDRLDREKQLPVDEAVRIATAVANALQHAHDRGVIHRDIKPANILTQDGEPVVADFGIALAVGAAGGSRLTETGLSVGTPYYMSPEQATGDQAIGPSSDTYALGAVLYEMLVGDPPYMGSTAQAVLGQIISGIPVSATAKRRSIPLNVDAAIQKSLEKLPADRFARAADFAAALADPAFRRPGAATAAAAAAGPWKLASGVLASVAVAAIAGLGWSLTRPAAPKRVARLSLARINTTLPTGLISLVPDGSGIVYRAPDASGTNLLWHQSFDDLTPAPIRGTEGAGTWHWVSADGRQVTYSVGATLRAVSIDGGPSRALSDDVNCCGVMPGDGFVYFLGSSGSAMRVPEAGGEAEIVSALEPGEVYRFVSDVLPDGRHALLTVFRGIEDADVRVVDLTTTQVSEPILLGAVATYAEPGLLIYWTPEGDVLATRFDPRELAVVGSPVGMVEDAAHVNAYGLAVSVSQSGDLIYRTSPTGGRLRVTPVWVMRDGREGALDPDWGSLLADPTNTSLSLSPDGSRLAISFQQDASTNLWVKMLDTGPLQRLTFEGSVNRRPAWSADGSTIMFVSTRSGSGSVWERRADGSSPARQVLTLPEGITDAVYSPDGAYLVLKVGLSAPTDIFAVPTAGDGEPIPLLTTEFNESYPALSPDGRWLAYVSTESGRSEVYVRPFPDVESGRWQISVTGGRSPLWAHHGEELFYRSADNELVAVRYASDPSFAVRGQETLFSMAPYLEPNAHLQYTLTPDDQRFVMLRLDAADESGNVPSEIILVQSFLEEVRARLGFRN